MIGRRLPLRRSYLRHRAPTSDKPKTAARPLGNASREYDGRWIAWPRCPCPFQLCVPTPGRRLGNKPIASTITSSPSNPSPRPCPSTRSLKPLLSPPKHFIPFIHPLTHSYRIISVLFRRSSLICLPFYIGLHCISQIVSGHQIVYFGEVTIASRFP